MPWTPLPRLAFAICTYPFAPSSPADLPLQIGDELYIIEEGGKDASWFRGYLVAPPSLLSGLTSSRGQTLEKRVFTGIFPRVCVEIRELLGDVTAHDRSPSTLGTDNTHQHQHHRFRSGHDADLLRPFPNTPSLDPAQSSVEPQSVSGQEESAAPRHGASPSTSATSFGSPHKPPAPVPMLKVGDESALAKDEPLVDEIASCLREWHSTKLHELLLAREYSTLDSMSALVARLDYARKQLFHGVLTKHELLKLRQATVWELVRGNKLLGQDVIVRSPTHKGRMLTTEDPAVEINKQQAIMSLLDDQPTTQPESKAPFHLYVNLKSFASDTTKQMTIALALYSKRRTEPARMLSEHYTADATSAFPGVAVSFDGMRKTLFTDIGPSETGEGTSDRASIFLVVKTISNENPASSYPLRSISERGEQADTIANLGATFRNAGQAGLKGGRQSLMWVRSRTKRDADAELKPGSRLGTAVSEASDPKATAMPSTADDAKKIKPVKKLTGLGIVDITKHLRGLQEGEVSVSIESLDSSFRKSSLTDDDRVSVINSIVGSGSIQTSSQVTNAVLNLHLKSFRADNSHDLIQETPTLLHSITASHRLGFASAPRKSRSDIYITLQRPMINDGASLSHPRAGSVPAFSEGNLSNLQLTLEVRDTNGKRIDKCIFPSSNSVGHVAWRSTAVERGEWWNQTLRLAIRPEKVPGSHIVMSLAEGYNFPFALCWMPLWVQGAFVQDGEHNLALYKYDEFTSTTQSGKGAYLGLPWNLRNKDTAVTGPLAWLELSTFLCSTAYSQDPNLLGLLHWKEKRADEMMKLLRKFPFVPEIEIVKLLKDVLNAVFGAMVEYSGNDEFEDMLFNAFTVILGIVNDRRFNLQPVLDDYIKNDFQYPLAFPSMVRSFTQLLQDPSNTDKSRRLRATCKVGGFVMKFIIKARELQIGKELGSGIKPARANVIKDLRPILTAIDNLMVETNAILVGTKTLMVQNFHSWLPELARVATQDEVFNIASHFVSSCSDVQGKLVLYKLLLIKHMTDEDVFKDETVRAKWQDQVVEWLDPYWGATKTPNPQWRDQIRLCCSVVSSIFDKFGSNTSAFSMKLVQSFNALDDIPKPTEDYFSPLFPSSYPFPTRATKVKDHYDEALLEVVALLSMIAWAPPSTYADLPADYLIVLLKNALKLVQSVLDSKAFPPTWLSVHIYNHRTVFNALEGMFTVLLARFLPLPDDATEFRDDLWRHFLKTLMKLTSSETLALETFSEQKRRAVWKIGGDIRELGAELLGRSWSTLGWETSPEERDMFGLDRMGGYQVSYVPGLVGDILELCFSVHESLRNVATGILHSMIVGEWTLNGNLLAIETAMIDGMDTLYTTKPLNDGMTQKLFIDELRTLFKSLDKSTDKRLYNAVVDLLDTVGEMFDLLVAVHAPEASSDTLQIMDTLRLLEYLRDMAKVDIFIGYVYKLARIQDNSQNLTEAALAMKMHADLHEWDTTAMLPAIADPPFPAQSSFDRKEQIYFEMIKHFEDGEDWHQALRAYTELSYQYQNYVFDFTKLARSQRAMATIYEKISNGERHQPRFFRVLFRGHGFSAGLRDRQFIFQALPGDRLASFTDKMQQQYPSAQVVAGGALDEIEGQYLSIYPISPQKDYEHPVNRRIRTAQPVKEYLMMAAPMQFANTTRRQATSANIEDQIQEKIIYTTAESFPTITRRSEIVATETVRLSPIQIGLERTSRKTQELQSRMLAVAEGGESALTALTDELVLLVGQDSLGAVSGYWKLVAGKTLASADARQDEVETANPLEGALKVALMDHVLMIRRALDSYSRSAHQATKNELSKDLERTFAPTIAYLNTLNASGSAPPVAAPSDAVPKITRNASSDVPAKDEPETGVAQTATAMPRPTVKVFGKPKDAKDDDPARASASSRLSRMNTKDSQDVPQATPQQPNGTSDADGSAERSRSFGGSSASKPALSAQASIQSLGARMGSVTKRLSALHIGGGIGKRGAKAPAPTSPVIREGE